MIKKAMILAAGFGKRIHPITLHTPKPLLKIGKETLLSNTIKFLKSYGVTQVVINVHYLGQQIIDYISQNKFDLKINTIVEKDKILDTGGGILNAIDFFTDSPFLVINPDTLWNKKYLGELKLIEELFFEKKDNKCTLLVVNKKKSFDKLMKGDFELKNNIIRRDIKSNLEYIYTGLQIVQPNLFSNLKSEVFSINDIWNVLIKNNNLLGFESKNDFYHVSTLDVYNNLLERKITH